MNAANEVAIVTGSGGTGCGRAIAECFARHGACVVVADINDAGGHDTVRSIAATGARAVFQHTDVGDEAQARDLIAFAEKTFGGVTILVNNASAPFRPADLFDHWADTVQTDLQGTMFCMRHAIDVMRRAGGGAIVNVASISGLWHGRRKPGAAAPAYDVAKAGMIRLTTALGPLLAKDNIRVNCLAPGWIATDGPRQYWESLTPAERKERGVPSTLLTTTQIADAIYQLATDRSLAGRVVVWWSDDEPRLIAWGDRGYTDATGFQIS